jgi:MATE family multidrug resistance protein
VKDGPVTTREVLTLAVPASLGMLLQHAFRPLDQFFAQYISADAQAALGASTFVVIVVFGAFVTVSGGVGPLVGRATGADDRLLRNRAIGTGLTLACGLAVVVALGALTLSWTIPIILGLSGAEAALTAEYLWWLGLTGAAIAVQPCVEAAFNAMGFTRRSMALQGLAVALNGGFTGTFVLVFGWGIAGAAIGTTLAQCIVTVLGVAWLWRTTGGFDVGVHPETVRRIVKLGLPVGLSVFTYAFVYWVLIRTSVAPLGQMKGLAVGFSALESISWPLFAGWSIAVSSLVARRLGAGQVQQAKRAIALAFPWSLGAGIAVAAVFMFGGPWLVDSFSADLTVRSQALVYAGVLAWSQPFVALESLFEGVLLGSGDTRRLAWVTIPLNAARVPLAWTLAVFLGFGAVGIWWAINITTLAKSVGKGLLVFGGRWADVDV